MLAPPRIYRAPDNQIKDPGGWSAFVVIAESHISVHTFPARKFVSADVYTCRAGLPREVASKCLREAFALSDIESNFLIRGKRYPSRDIAPQFAAGEKRPLPAQPAASRATGAAGLCAAP